MPDMIFRLRHVNLSNRCLSAVKIKYWWAFHSRIDTPCDRLMDITCGLIYNTSQSRYTTVIVSENLNGIHFIARPWGPGMDCLLWAQNGPVVYLGGGYCALCQGRSLVVMICVEYEDDSKVWAGMVSKPHDDVIKWKHFPRYWPFVRSFDVFFDMNLNKQLSKQSRCWWFETSSGSLWRQCNEKTRYINQHGFDKLHLDR